MKLMRLLAAGRSVIGIKKDPGPYRMNQENLLPQFVATQKTALPLKQPLDAAAEKVDDQAPAVVISTPVEKREAGKPQANCRSRSHGRGTPTLLKRLAARFLRLGRRNESAPTGRKPSYPIQTELSLDTVR